MKTIKKKKNRISKKTILIALPIAIAVLIVGWVLYAYTSSSWPFTAPAPTTTNSQTDANSNDTDTNRKTTTEDPDDSGPSKSPPQYEGPDPNTEASLTGFVSYSSVVDGSLLIRVTIDQALNSGTCELTLSRGNASITKTSNIVANPSSSTCNGFDVSTSELNSGTWTILIHITSGSKTGTISGETTI